MPADDSITQRHTLNKFFSRFISQLTSHDMVYEYPFSFSCNQAYIMYRILKDQLVSIK